MSDTDYVTKAELQTVLKAELQHMTGIIIESFEGQLAKAVESIDERIAYRVRPIIQEELAEVTTDIRVINAAVTDMSGQVQAHENSITHLEATA